MDIIKLIQYIFEGPIAQDQSYHNFCDGRSFLGIPNFMDVISNAPFLLFGYLGIRAVRSLPVNISNACKVMWFVFFLITAVIGLGSAYYHWAPDNHTLVWDRLPMAASFMALMSVIITERISPKLGKVSFPTLIIFGLLSVWYWDYTESLGVGDLRPYALVQYGSMLAFLLIIAFKRRGFQLDKYLYLSLAFYVLAKVFESFDCQVYNLTNHFISGHTIKHLLATLGVFALLGYIRKLNELAIFAFLNK